MFWEPKYFGLKSIPHSKLEIRRDQVCIPKDMTNPGGPLYRRVMSGDQYWEYIKRQEEPFNYLFDLVFGIVPGSVVAKIFESVTGRPGADDYESIGVEQISRYQWGRKLTHSDGFFVSSSSLLAVELKFNAKTSLDQLTKYMILFLSEEEYGGRRSNLDLVYVFNSDPVKSFQKQIGFLPAVLGSSNCGQMIDSVKAKRARMYLEGREDQLSNVLDRVRIHCIHWGDFKRAILGLVAALGNGEGDETLARLLEGLCHEIDAHPLSNIQPGH